MKSKRRGLGGVAGANFTDGGLVVAADVERVSRVLELKLEVVSLDVEPLPPPPLVMTGAMLFRRGMLRSSWRSCSL